MEATWRPECPVRLERGSRLTPAMIKVDVSVLFDVGNNQVKRVPLMDPLRGTASLTSDLLDQVETVDALLAKLQAS